MAKLSSVQVWLGIVAMSGLALLFMGTAKSKGSAFGPDGTMTAVEYERYKVDLNLEAEGQAATSHDGGAWYLNGVVGTTADGVVYGTQALVYNVRTKQQKDDGVIYGDLQTTGYRAVKSAGSGGTFNDKVYGPDGLDMGTKTGDVTNPTNNQPLPDRWMTLGGGIYGPDESQKASAEALAAFTSATSRGTGVQGGAESQDAAAPPQVDFSRLASTTQQQYNAAGGGVQTQTLGTYNDPYATL